jgi:hypothetical protein
MDSQLTSTRRMTNTIDWDAPFDIDTSVDIALASELADRPGEATATGHVVGETYLSLMHGQRYTVEAVATLWILAPNGAVRIRWANGNSTLSEMARGNDPIFCAHG